MAADLDGVGDFYSVTPTLGDDFTLMGWFRADTFTGFSCPFGRGNTTNQMLILNNSSGVLQLDINLASNQGSTLTTGVWNHLAVRRGETGANDFEFFLNGVLDITTTNAITLVDEIRIGDDFFGDDWDGQVAGIKLFDDNLTLAEIRNEMSTYVPKFLQKAAPINLASWWPVLAGSAGERIRDYSGNGNDFTENGNPSDASVDPGISWGAESVYIGQVVVAPTGTGVVTLQAAALSGVGVMQPSGAGALALGDEVLSGVGVEKFLGTGVVALSASVLAGVGVMQPAGTGALSLSTSVLAAVGLEEFIATGVIALSNTTLAAVGVMQPSGTAALLLDASVLAGVGIGGAVAGTGVMLLDAATLAGVGVMLPSGTGVIVIDAAVIAATGVGALVIGPPDHRGLLRPPGRLLH